MQRGNGQVRDVTNRKLAIAAAGLLLAAPGLLLAQGRIDGCDLYPADHVWNAPIDHLPVHPQSAQFIASIGSGTGLHADFGAGDYDGSIIGIPYESVTAAQPDVPMLFFWWDESDAGAYPFPPDATIEGEPNATGDRHVLVLDHDACILYETFDSWPPGELATGWCDDPSAWCAWSGATFDLSSYPLRPDGWTSADAAGLPILPGLVRYEEVQSGEIRHAIRFTASTTRNAYVWPARHQAGATPDSNVPAMGQRFRLKAGFDVSTYSPEIQVILRALKRYGLILADNGSDWFLSGAPHEGWDNDMLQEVGGISGGDFEAVDASSLRISSDSGRTTHVFSDGFESGAAGWWSSAVP